MQIFDLIVIGAGSGLDVAAGAADAGLKVAIIEDGPLGGTCLNRGCIPSKMIIHSADMLEAAQHADKIGLSLKAAPVNLKRITERASSLVDEDAHNIEKGVKAAQNQTLFKGRGVFIDAQTIEVNGEQIRGKKIVIATGSRPFIPPVKGLDTVPFLTSTEALRLTTLPQSMIIIGGGYIGAELGHFFSAMGTDVTIVQRNTLLIPREDGEIAGTFTRLWMKRRKVYTNAEVTAVSRFGGKVRVQCIMNEKKKILTAEKILVAAGVRPNTDSLGLEQAGVRINEKGFVLVNRYLETSAKNIWALGDVVGEYLFKHSANLEAEYVLDAVTRKRKSLLLRKPINYFPMPHAIFSSPQIAGVGLTEEEAKRLRKKYVVGKYEYKNTGMGAALAEENGFVKFIVEQKTKEILGCHILGPDASTLIHEVCVALKANRKKALEIIRSTVHVHPALSEVVQRAAWRVPV
ncbi:dihydrolipoyl dehydrogenase [Candidatus Woesearchaeota archaeon]|nr:dihydrolipoyl dehydrogenase [Candidatus Woesearchaeota archaeon]